MSDLQIAHQIILENRYMTLATAAADEVWAAPVAYVFDPRAMCFYFYSALDSVHCRHIAQNPTVAIAIFNSAAPSDAADGLQFKARVQEVQEAALPQVLSFYFEQSFADPAERAQWQRPAADFLSPSPQRFYSVAPLDLFKLDLASIKIDRRKTLDLQEFFKFLRFL